MSRPPVQVAPVNRRDFINPISCVDYKGGSVIDRLHIYLDLINGANYNDPQPFQGLGYAQAKRTA